ncbi:MAG: septum site-determining protein MinD [Clostridiales bacterium]|nr:septum site-determining protein MinD [Clostridiales bacterium]
MSRSFLIASGKGGVGKSSVAASLGQALASRGLRVVIVDCDTGLRCQDLMLGLQDKVIYDFQDVCEKRCMLQEALYPVQGWGSLFLLSASQIMRAAEIRPKDVQKIAASLGRTFDIVLLDCPAGVGRSLKVNFGSVEEYILVTTPDDVALRDAERTCQVMAEHEILHPHLIVNRWDKNMVRRGEMQSPRQLAMALDLPLLGAVPESEHVYRGLLRHQTAYQCGDKQVKMAFDRIASRLMGDQVPVPDEKLSPVRRFFLRSLV